MKSEVKIVLDADVVIHFIEGECFALLFEIFPEYDCLLLDVVYDELFGHRITKIMIDHYILLSQIEERKF